jgi:alpha-beta hydrolase superfamily lysophospholipase
MADSGSHAEARLKRPWYHPLNLAKRLVIYALIAYVTFCVYLFSMQTRMIYVGITYPMSTETAVRNAKSVGLVPWEHTTPGATAPQGYVRPDFAAPAPRGTIVVFHGNGEFAWMRPDMVQACTQRGFRVFLYEYPGYGGRPGRPSEATIVPDGRAVIRALDHAGYGPIYVWGQSLGSGVAAAVCADPSLPIHGLALLTPWDNIANVGLYLYPYLPIRPLMKDRYDSIANLEHFRHPICVIRGDKDEIIPPPLSLNLYAHLPEPKKIIVKEGYGHGDWPDSPDLPWWDDALNFIAPKS